jgi:phenylalanyl-tRNA synthetase beta chain
MHLTLDVLRRFTDLPADPAATRLLLDQSGLEVKRIDPGAPGVPLTLELLANRGDHHCYVGVARELSGRTGAALREPGSRALTVGESPHLIRLETDLCPIYTLTALERVGEGSLSAEALELLASTQQHAVSPVVDATNIANAELGQPTHAFDADTIRGAIVVRTSRPGEQAWPLFATAKVILPEGTIVIADEEKVLAIAGVIGCEESKTTANTTRVLLESAGFDPVSVRKASRALDIHTDSSARFERGADFSLPLRGAGRVAELLAPAGWVVRGSSGVVGTWSDPRRSVRFDPAACRRFLHVETPDAELVARLRRYGFLVGPSVAVDARTGAEVDPDVLQVIVPPHRLWDVEHPADLYEEIAKSLGYDETPVALPLVDMGALPGQAERTRMQIEEVLVGHGFYEVITDGFYGRGVREQLGLQEGHPLWEHVSTLNAIDRGYGFLKNNALAQAVEGVAASLRRAHREVKAFEFTRTFHPDSTASNSVCTERRVAWAITSGHSRPPGWSGAPRPADALFLKGIVEELALRLRLPLTFGPASNQVATVDCLHPNRRLGVWLDGVPVGVIGEVHPSIVAAFKIKRATPCYLELDLAALEQPGRVVPFVEPSRFNPAIRNLAFTLPHRVEAGEVVAQMRAAGPDWLRSVEIVDLYEHEEGGAPVRTFTYALTWLDEGVDRSAEEINAASEGLIAAVLASLGARGVRLRA